MTLRTDRAGDDTEPPGLIPDVADDLADMLRRGRTVGGEAVTRVMFRLADGRQVSAELPAPRAVEQGEQEREDDADIDTDPEGKVLRLLEALRPGEWMSGRAVAGELGLTYGGGRFKAVMRPLLAEGGAVESHKVHGYRLRRRPN